MMKHTDKCIIYLYNEEVCELSDIPMYLAVILVSRQKCILVPLFWQPCRNFQVETIFKKECYENECFTFFVKSWGKRYGLQM